MTAETGDARIYTVVVNREKTVLAELAGLVVNTGLTSVSPNLNSLTHVYALSVTNEVGSVTVVPTALSPIGSSITIDGVQV